jgi:hypothetical protein
LPGSFPAGGQDVEKTSRDNYDKTGKDNFSYSSHTGNFLVPDFSLAPGLFEPAEIFLYCFFVFAGDFILTDSRGGAVTGGLNNFRKITLRFAFDLRFLKIPTGYYGALSRLVFQTGSLC